MRIAPIMVNKDDNGENNGMTMEQLSPDLGGFCMLIAMFAGTLALRLGLNLRDY